MAVPSLDLKDWEPKSMLELPVTRVTRPKFPVIDFHTHLTWDNGLDHGGQPQVLASADDLLPTMDAVDVRTMVNLTGGHGDFLRQALTSHQHAHPDRFIVFTEPAWGRVNEPNYPRDQADTVEAAVRAGARGLKILKTLGLFLRQEITAGPLIPVDDPRFDLMWDAAGKLGIPVAIHTSDPRAFFQPIDRFNERWDELQAHPDWSFYGPGFPSNGELQEARRRVMTRHPGTNFVCLHVADPEDLSYVSECMEAHPNMFVDIAARISELGRQPRAARKFIDRYQDRVVFGTDAVPGGLDMPQQLFCEELYEIYYRFLETEDEYFVYAPLGKSPQGRWRISGLGLPESILRKVYLENARRLLNLT
ncbi:MAG: amidohydrolase family protein [Bryobacteraceae bacterium]